MKNKNIRSHKNILQRKNDVKNILLNILLSIRLRDDRRYQASSKPVPNLLSPPVTQTRSWFGRVVLGLVSHVFEQGPGRKFELAFLHHDCSSQSNAAREVCVLLLVSVGSTVFTPWCESAF